MWMRKLFKKKIWHLSVVSYVVVLFMMIVCVVVRQRDYPIKIRHRLSEYAEDQALLAVAKPVLPDNLRSKVRDDSDFEWCLFIADRKGRIKCVTGKEWDHIIRQDDTLTDAYMCHAGWYQPNSMPEVQPDDEEKRERSETVQVYDAIMKNDSIKYLDRRIHLNSYYMTRLVNEIYPSVTVGWSCWGPAMPYPEIDSRDLYTGMVVAYGEERMALGYADSQIGLVHMDSPTTEYALRKLAELAVIGEKEMSRRLRE